MCGPVTQQKIFGGNKTGVFDYPWMALLFYDTGSQAPEYRCGGSLINKRYVLTAAHCVTALPSSKSIVIYILLINYQINLRSLLYLRYLHRYNVSDLRLIGVRLGEHNLSTDPDCDKDADGMVVVCAERYQDFGIESTHFHPNYSRLEFRNDIALLRLNGNANLIQNVRPVCLPIGSASILNQKKVRTIVKDEYFFLLTFFSSYDKFY